MHFHKYEKIWLIFGISSLAVFLVVIGIGAFYKGTHPPSEKLVIDSQNVQAEEAFKEENLGLTKVEDDKYIVNIIASAFNYDLGTDDEGSKVDTIRIPKGSTVLFQAVTKDVVHGFEIAGTNVNMMIEPGYISSYEAVMDKPGEYTLVCNEYCGTGHHLMFATVEVYE